MSVPFERLREIFLVAVACPSPDQREAYLDQACNGNLAIRQRVAQLLKAHEAEGSLLDGCALGIDETAPFEPNSEAVGTIIGPYKLLEQIGEGGFGVVFMAEQTQPVRRKVALKVLKPGMDTRQVIARFEAERQALAIMDHPNIARVFDGGAAPSGRPYFVMELVKGVPITDFCDQNHLTPRQRLELVIAVCQAVQHAHQKGIIHRDLKPSNVLVTLHDTTPVVKVIDFGVAKALGQELTDKTLFTGFAQMIGTPQYMSPEQAGESGLDIDTRSDIYSLGVLLYELLTGTTPFTRERFSRASYDEIRRVIREEEPPRPSTRLSDLGRVRLTPGAAGTSPAERTTCLASVSELRQTEPVRLTKLVRGELDWIVMKALEKDRNRRYESASAFAADVQRYLNDEPVLACPLSVGYRFRKFARRNKRVAIMASFALVLGVVAVAVLGASYARVRDALRDRTQALEREQQSVYVQRIAMAAQELTANRLGRAEELLDACPPSLRGWEWHYFKRRRYQDLRELPHPDAVLNVAYSPDGSRLATGCVDGTVTVWDTRTWRAVHPPRKCHANHVYAVAFCPQGRYLATGGNDRKIHVRDLRDGSLIHTFTGHTDAIRQLAFSPDGRRLASASDDQSVRIWDLETQESLVFREHGDAVRGVAFDASGQVVSASADGEVKVWEPTSGSVHFAHRGRIRWVSTMAFDPGSRRLALASWDGTVELWDDLPASEVHTLDGHMAQITGLAFSPDGHRLVTAADDRRLKLWDTASGQEVVVLDVGDLMPIGVAFGPDGLQLAVTCGTWQVKICDATPLSGIEEGEEIFTLTGHQHRVLQVRFSEDSRRVVSASRDGTVKVWDALTRQEIITFRGHKAIVSAAAFSTDGGRVASASWDGNVLIWEVRNGEVVYTLSGQAGFVYDVAFSPDGQYLASAHANGTVILWDPRTGKQIHPPIRADGHERAHGYEAVSVAFDSNSRLLATAGGRDHTAKVWDVRTGEEALWLEIESTEKAAGRIRRLTFSPDNKWLATVGHGSLTTTPCVIIWDAATGKFVRALDGRGKRLFDVAFSRPDGRWIASGGQDETLMIWDATTGEESTLRGPAGEVLGLVFSPDRRFLASCGGYKGKGEIKIWDTALLEKKR